MKKLPTVKTPYMKEEEDKFKIASKIAKTLRGMSYSSASRILSMVGSILHDSATIPKGTRN